MKLFFLLGNQLFDEKYLEKFKKDHIFYMAEDFQLCTYEKHHKNKILLFLSSMRSHADRLKKSKFKIEEISRNLPYYDEIIEDNQARFLHVKIKNINVICIYLPNGNPAPGEKYDYKISWMKRLINYSREIYEKNEPVIIGGDFNVIQSEIDCYDLSKWTNDALYLEPTRKKMKELINIGFIDSFRLMNPHVKDYSFWDYQGGAWQKDNGIRIDFFLTSPEIVDRLLFAGIDKNPRGKEKPSDHTPIWIELEDK